MFTTLLATWMWNEQEVLLYNKRTDHVKLFGARVRREKMAFTEAENENLGTVKGKSSTHEKFSSAPHH